MVSPRSLTTATPTARHFLHMPRLPTLLFHILFLQDGLPSSLSTLLPSASIQLSRLSLSLISCEAFLPLSPCGRCTTLYTSQSISRGTALQCFINLPLPCCSHCVPQTRTVPYIFLYPLPLPPRTVLRCCRDFYGCVTNYHKHGSSNALIISQSRQVWLDSLIRITELKSRS